MVKMPKMDNNCSSVLKMLKNEYSCHTRTQQKCVFPNEWNWFLLTLRMSKIISRTLNAQDFMNLVSKILSQVSCLNWRSIYQMKISCGRQRTLRARPGWVTNVSGWSGAALALSKIRPGRCMCLRKEKVCVSLTNTCSPAFPSNRAKAASTLFVRYTTEKCNFQICDLWNGIWI